MTWLQKLLPPRIKRTPGERRTPVPEGLWVKCPECEAVLYRTDLEKNLNVCPKCAHHSRVPARERIEQEYGACKEAGLPVSLVTDAPELPFPIVAGVRRMQDVERALAVLAAVGDRAAPFRHQRLEAL